MSNEPRNGKIFPSMSAVLSEVGPILKAQTNKAQGFKFRGIDQVYTALNPLFAKHHIFIMSEVLEHKYEVKQTVGGKAGYQHFLKVKFDFISGKDGSSVCAHGVGEAFDLGDKGVNKCLSVALKYAAFQAFMIPTEELKNSDPDNEATELDHSKQQSAKPTEPAKPAPVSNKDVERWQDWKITFKSEHKGKTLSQLCVEDPTFIEKTYEGAVANWDVHGPRGEYFKTAIGYLKTACQFIKNLTTADELLDNAEPVKNQSQAKPQSRSEERAAAREQSEEKTPKEQLDAIEDIDPDNVPF